MFDTSFKLLLRRLGLILGLYMLLRVAFYFFHYTTFVEAGATETLLAFLHGLRFDVAAIIITNSLFIVLSLLPFGNTLRPAYQRLLKWVFILSNSPFIALGLVDVEFFHFIGRRSSNELFTITGDISNQLGQLAVNYWYLIIAFIVLVLCLMQLYPKTPAAAAPTPPVWKRSLRLLLVAALAVFGIRGGWQLKPLRPSHAFMLEPASLGHLTLNTPFTFIKSIGQTRLEEKQYYTSEAELLAALPFNADYYEQQAGEPKRDNVVIIILEGFAAEYVGALNNGQGYTPFLDSLASEGILFQNAFANGRKSIEALPSILAGIPSLMQEPFITSPYQANEFYGLGHVLQQQGYRTAMFHGAANGTMGFNDFARAAGIKAYYGLNEYPASLRASDFDGQWGIFDEPYLKFIAKELSTFEKPFMATLFTLSSHQPYTIPGKYKGRFPKGELEIHESIGYADFALREFFRSASREAWYHNTLFVVTADHTQQSIAPAYQNETGHYRVPLLLFHPAKELDNVSATQITQHTDIMPTVIDYLNIPTDRLLPFGRSVFDSTSAGNALFFNGNSWFMVQQDQVTELTQDDQVRFYTLAELAPAPPAPASEQLLKAYVQYFRKGMIENRLYLHRE